MTKHAIEIRVGDRVRFVGPVYGFPAEGPCIGQVGTVTEQTGYWVQPAGKARYELIAVAFDGDRKPSVVDLTRVELLEVA